LIKVIDFIEVIQEKDFKKVKEVPFFRHLQEKFFGDIKRSILCYDFLVSAFQSSRMGDNTGITR